MARAPAHHHDLGFVLIAVFKLIKGLLLLVVAAGTLSFLSDSMDRLGNHWAALLQVRGHSRFIQNTLIQLGLMTNHNVVLLSLTSLTYAAVLLTEAIGLLFEKVWAEYLTVIMTASFIPWEIYEIVQRVTWVRVTLLTINTVVVVYLIGRLRQRHVERKR